MCAHIRSKNTQNCIVHISSMISENMPQCMHFCICRAMRFNLVLHSSDCVQFRSIQENSPKIYETLLFLLARAYEHFPSKGSIFGLRLAAFERVPYHLNEQYNLLSTFMNIFDNWAVFFSLTTFSQIWTNFATFCDRRCHRKYSICFDLHFYCGALSMLHI